MYYHQWKQFVNHIILTEKLYDQYFLFQNELEYAKEFKKFYKAPKEIFIR